MIALNNNLKGKHFCLMIVLLIGVHCKKNEINISSKLNVRFIAPQSGKFGITDSIHGSGFGNNINNVQVFYGGTAAHLLSISDTMILATVEKNSESGYITVIKGNDKVTGPSFIYLNMVTVSTFAGKGFAGYKNGNLHEAIFNFPRGLAMDKQGNLFVADFGNYCIRKISIDGIVSTFAGNGNKAFKDGPAHDASFTALNGILFDDNDDLYIADAMRLRKWWQYDNIVKTFAGNENMGSTDGTGLNTNFSLLYGLSKDAHGNIYASDVINNNIRKITSNASVITIAGLQQGYADGSAAQAQFNFPGAIAFDTSGSMYIADAGNFRIRTIVSGIVNTYAGNGKFGYADGRFFNAEFKFPTGITVDKKNNVYVCGEDNAIRKITAQGDVTTIAGKDEKGFKDGTGYQALFNQPVYMLTAPDGSIYVSDHSNHSIRKIVIE